MLKKLYFKSLRPPQLRNWVETLLILLLKSKIIDTNNYQIDYFADSALGGLRPSYPIAVSKELSGFRYIGISRSFHISITFCIYEQ